jgi:hypothetical protein
MLWMSRDSNTVGLEFLGTNHRIEQLLLREELRIARASKRASRIGLGPTLAKLAGYCAAWIARSPAAKRRAVAVRADGPKVTRN